jgi:outer membrane protein assembly factor BamB
MKSDWMGTIYRAVSLLAGIAAWLACDGAAAADWPTYGYDAARSGATPQQLPSTLALRWSLILPPRQPSWRNTHYVHKRRMVDNAYHPVVFGKQLYLGCDHNGALVALDTESGQERWRFYTGGPVRSAPVATTETVFVGSDDGILYAVDASTGKERWRVAAGPVPRMVIGHEKLMSAWGVGSGPALAGGVLVFAGASWPTEGVFAHGVDPATGKVLWTQDQLEVRPYGYLSSDGERVFISSLMKFQGAAVISLRNGKPIADPQAKPPAAKPAPLPDIPGVTARAAHRIAADDKLFVVTDDNRLCCYAAPAGADAPARTLAGAKPPEGAAEQPPALAAGMRTGISLVWGLRDGSLVEHLLRGTALHVVAWDRDAAIVDAVRRRLDGAGWFATHRLQIMAGDGAAAGPPPWIAHLITSENPTAAGLDDPTVMATAFRSLHPYGGALALPGDRRAAFAAAVSKHRLERAEVGEGGGISTLVRAGALTGAADWTHEFADPGNRLAVRDTVAGLPLGVLWFEGPAAQHKYYFDGAIKNHDGGNHVGSPLPPQAEYSEGRLFLQGRAVLAAFDQYTGRLLWEAALPDTHVFDALGVHAAPGLTNHANNPAKEPWRYGPALQVEVPPTWRPRASGYSFCAMADSVYVCAGKTLIRIRAGNGERLAAWEAPVPPTRDEPWCWGHPRAQGNVLVATLFKPSDVAAARAGADGNGGAWVKERMRMSHVVALDRESGKRLWSQVARSGFLDQGVAVGGGKAFCVDLVSAEVSAQFKASGVTPPSAQPVLRAFDLADGKEAWSAPLSHEVLQLTYSPEHDLLIVPARGPTVWRDGAWVSESKGPARPGTQATGLLRAYRGKDGQPLYERAEHLYFEPHCLLGDRLIDRYGWPYDLSTGKPSPRVSRLTGLSEPWGIPKSGCNHLLVSDGVVGHRHGVFDLAEGVSCKFWWMNGGCVANHTPAGGLLNAPNFGIKHDGPRSTALAFYRQPANDLWGEYIVPKSGPPAFFTRIGINFGAPGDRATPQGTVWVSPQSPAVSGGVKIAPATASPFRVSSLRCAAAEAQAIPWVASCGLVGARQITLPLGLFLPKGPGIPKDATAAPAPRAWTVRLHFAEPDEMKPGGRIFSVSVQGQGAVKDLDVVAAAGGPRRGIVRECRGVAAKDTLTITLEPAAGETLINGVELIGGQP